MYSLVKIYEEIQIEWRQFEHMKGKTEVKTVG